MKAGGEKKLEQETHGLREKNAAANREIGRLREELRKREEGVAQVRQAADLLLTAAALRWGTPAGTGVYELDLESVGPELLERWRLELEIRGGRYTLRAEKKEI